MRPIADKVFVVVLVLYVSGVPCWVCNTLWREEINFLPMQELLTLHNVVIPVMLILFCTLLVAAYD